MRKVLIAALTAATLPAVGGVAHAQGYGYLPAPAYVTAGVTYDDRHRGFTIAGARAGITVLGIDLDGSAGVKLSLHDQPGHRVYAAPQPPVYASGPAYGGGYGYGGGYADGGAYAGGGYAGGGYATGYGGGGYATGYDASYVQQGYAPAPMGYGCAGCAPPPPSPCGC